MFPFSAIVTAQGSIIFTDRDGKSNTITSDNSRYQEAKDTLKEISTRDSSTPIDDLVDRLAEISNPIKSIFASSGGRINVRSGIVYYLDGKTETVVNNVVAERIIWMLTEGFDAKPMLLFLDNLMNNPSYRSVNDLYRFMEKHCMGITPDGYILAYKRVRDDFKDIYTGTYDNSPGQHPTMRRNEVEDNPDVVCSNGLHVCSFDYLQHFGSGAGNRVVICRVDPRHVVSVPVDYNDAKMRVCEYEVLSEVLGDANPLVKKSVIVEADLEHDADECPDCHEILSRNYKDVDYCPECGWEEDFD